MKAKPRRKKKARSRRLTDTVKVLSFQLADVIERLERVSTTLDETADEHHNLQLRIDNLGKRKIRFESLERRVYELEQHVDCLRRLAPTIVNYLRPFCLPVPDPNKP